MPTPSLRIFILLALASLPAAAENWQTVLANEEMRVEIDTATLLRNDDSVRAWERETFAKPRQATPGDFFFKSAKSLALHQCARHSTTYLYRGYYGDDGREIKSLASPAELGGIDYLIPGSPEERKLTFACAYKSESAKRGKSPEPPPETTEAKPAAPAKASADAGATPPPSPGKPTPAAKAPAGK